MNVLVRGTLNVELDEPHELRHDFILPQEQNNRPEHLYFESCTLLIAGERLDAVIAPTSTNFHGSAVIEIMTIEHLKTTRGLKDGDSVDIEIEES